MLIKEILDVSSLATATVLNIKSEEAENTIKVGSCLVKKFLLHPTIKNLQKKYLMQR